MSMFAADDWKPLFNGKDFTGWTFFSKDAKADPKDTWSVKDGVMMCTGKPNGYIVTAEEHADYCLKLKWRWEPGSKGGNSGVLLHVSGPEKIWPKSVEAQLMHGRAGDFWLIDSPALKVDSKQQDPKNARHFLRKGDKVEKEIGEWNEYEITCSGGDITLIINGKEVNKGTAGSLKKGKIAFQAEGAPVQFKDFMIKSLK
jgi:hypothetical protein